MSSKVNEALFDLVKSMTKSEKRYFKLLSSRHTIGEENNYVKLFDFIDKQSSYDEADIHREFSGEAFLNRFSITKKRLYDHVLGALDAYHISNSTEAQIYRLIHSADILFEKSLYEQSRRLLRRAEKLARKHEFEHLLITIISKQKKLFETTGYNKMTDDKIESIASSEQLLFESLNCQSKLWGIKSRLFGMMSQRGVARSKKEVDEYKKIFLEIQRIEFKDSMITELNYLYHHTLSAYYYAIGDTVNSLKELRCNFKLFQSEQGYLIPQNKQVSAYTNAIYLSDKMGDYKEALKYLSELKGVANSVDTTEDLGIKLFSSISSIELSMCLRRGDFTEALKVANSVKTNLDKYDNKIIPTRRAFLEFKLAVVHMGVGEFNEALKWVNSILNNSKLDSSEDIIGFAQLLDLLIHIELNNNELLPYTLKSAQRFFKNRNRLYNFEKVFLQFVSKLIKCEDRFSEEDRWEELYKSLTLLSDERFDQVALEYFDFKAWAESKLKRKKFDTVLKENYSKQIRIAS